MNKDERLGGIRTMQDEAQDLIAKLVNRDLIYSDLVEEIKTAQGLLNEVKILSNALKETIDSLQNRCNDKLLRYEDLPDYLTIEELKLWLRLGTNKTYDLANTHGFPTIRVGNKNIFAKAQVKEFMENISQNNSKKLLG